ncbi:MAG: DHH family phosphoesterase [Bacteroidetes bacterium]|nr:DHH family phosphoesterase [Bacteroidota bacterium]MCL2303168.1 DHH family phosphoesterase [Lentimicrobiaceae bacterium]
MLTLSQISEFQQRLTESKKIAVCTHYNPDGDAIGSSLALQSYFATQGFEIKCVIPNNMPEFYTWMPGAETIVNAQKQFKEAKKILAEADILFLVDMNAEHRSGVDLQNHLLQTSAYKVLIDHHPNPAAECALVYSDTKVTSTCENVYRFLTEISDKPFLNKEIGSCIYTGIITDTGSLSYVCNDPETYLLLAKLMEVGVNGEDIHREIYDNYAESRIRLLGLSLNKLKVFPHLGTSYMYLTQEEMKKCSFKDGDTEGFVNYGISLKGIYFTAFFTEREKRIRVSFRSKGTFDVNQFAQTYFQGGGHRNAAASYHYDTLENTIKYFEEVIHKHPELSGGVR